MAKKELHAYWGNSGFTLVELISQHGWQEMALAGHACHASDGITSTMDGVCLRTCNDTDVGWLASMLGYYVEEWNEE